MCTLLRQMPGQVPITPERYHHGDLRRALVDAGVSLARANGPGAVVLREATRRVGVSHNASYRHFAARDELLRAVAERCMSEFALLIERRVAAVAAGTDAALDARLRLRACGLSYLEFALTESGWFRTAFAVPRRLDHFGPGQGVGTSGLNPYELLGRCLDDLTAGVIPPERRPGSEIAAWSAVHGLATLLIDGPLRDAPQAERDEGLARVLDVVERGL